MQEILEKIRHRTGIDLVTILAEELSGSALNSLLLEVFDRKARQLKPSQLLQQYRMNRFVQPAAVDVLQVRAKELSTLQWLQQCGFVPLELSPVSPLGTCAAVGPVSQKKIISAIRGTEVLSDATNAIALHIADQKKRKKNTDLLKFCTTHRHVRTPPVKVKGHSPHFTIACCVSAGIDTGNLAFEINAVREHFLALQSVLLQVFQTEVKYFKLQPRAGYKQGDQLAGRIFDEIKNMFPVVVDTTAVPNDYYQGIQYKAVINVHGEEIEIADGGFVNWTQQLLENKKERCFISGLGIDYLSQIM
ncbi:hypothetical protein [Chitinophaga filiformis]|uniref:Uncharacterized protein n=1 Tax=Chitinophaga filiformis TaxID=104663 RepID=A0A1G7HS67_CHIFI|nr:hypothetical protein [Chitinophaga filiformis]SDF03341.1 hypothetical protein SAMN04488121_101584 [Chitinophaga filiformis]